MLERIKEIIMEYVEIDPGDITPDSSLRDLGINSYEFMNIVARFEQELSIVIPDRDIHLLETVADTLAYLENAVSKKS
ncbi:MAG: acyl carrier protein [Bacillota bacterium]